MTTPAPAPLRRESPRARRALLDYLHLGPGRTFQALLLSYRDLKNPPTRSFLTLRSWSSLYNWTARASRFDALEEERLQSEYRARRQAVLQNGLALDHERVQDLIILYQKLASFARSDEALWYTDVKAVRLEQGSVERVERRRFNGELIRQLRGLLDDIAVETGGRLNRPSRPALLEGSDPQLDTVTLDVLTPAERAEFLRLQDKIFSPPPAGPEISPEIAG
ncbi:MAG TPA: hypothetical protein VGK00_06795 [Anaerolineales bacterium]|jgi:hypothetical protein